MLISQEELSAPWQEDDRIRATQRRTVRVLAAAQIVGGIGVGVAASLGPSVGGVILIGAAVVTSIPMLLVGMLLFGIGSATNQQSRYAAADLATPHRRAQALSIVVWATTRSPRSR